jgi:hypothetical protein
MIDLTHATAVRTPYGWYDVIAINATTVTVAADFWPIRIPKRTNPGGSQVSTTTRIEFGAATSTGNVHSRYWTRDEAQAFADDAPTPMHILARQTSGDAHGAWVHA